MAEFFSDSLGRVGVFREELEVVCRVSAEDEAVEDGIVSGRGVEGKEEAGWLGLG